jgi:hypothetical protein
VGEQVQYEEEGSSLCCTCVHVTQAVADSLVFFYRNLKLHTYATLDILHIYHIMMEKLCKTYSFHGLVIGLFDFFSAVYKFSSASRICETLR